MPGLIRCHSVSCERWVYLTPEEDEAFARLDSDFESVSFECPYCGQAGAYRRTDQLDEQLTNFYDQLLDSGRRLGYIVQHPSELGPWNSMEERGSEPRQHTHGVGT